MATKDQIFVSKYLKAEDVKKPTVLEIEVAIIQDLKNPDGVTSRKPVLFFRGTKKQFVVNATNFDAIVDITGESDTDQWAGHKIEVFPTTTMMAGKKVACIRIRAPQAPSQKTPAATEPGPEGPSSSLSDEMSDEIPF